MSAPFRLWTLLLLMCIGIWAFAQTNTNVQDTNQYPTGLIFDEAAYDTLARLPLFKGNDFDLPPRVSLKAYCPTPKHQGYGIGSCTGWAISYGAFSIQNAVEKGWTNQAIINQNAFSALYVYNPNKVGSPYNCLSGAVDINVLNYLANQGTITSREFDINVTDCQKKPTAEQKVRALQNRIRNYVKLFDKNTSPTEKIQQTKENLHHNLPVVIGVKVPANPGYPNNYTLTRLEQNNHFWYPSQSTKTGYNMGHSLVVVGYDDSKQAFEVMNSWGQQWGNRGFAWINYNEFARITYHAFQLQTYGAILVGTGIEHKKQAVRTEKLRPAKEKITKGRTITTVEIDTFFRPWQPPNSSEEPLVTIDETKEKHSEPTPIIDKINEPEPPKPIDLIEQIQGCGQQQLAGKFAFRYLADEWANEYETAAIDFARNRHQAKTQAHSTIDWQVGQEYQLVTQSDLAQEYIYIFSFDAKQQANIHWPRPNETALVPYPSTKVYIPNHNRTMFAEHAGTEYLCMLFACEPIEDIAQLVREVENEQGDFMTRLWKVLDTQRIAQKYINFADQKLEFRSIPNSKSTGTIVPLVLEININ